MVTRIGHVVTTCSKVLGYGYVLWVCGYGSLVSALRDCLGLWVTYPATVFGCGYVLWACGYDAFVVLGLWFRALGLWFRAVRSLG